MTSCHDWLEIEGSGETRVTIGYFRGSLFDKLSRRQLHCDVIHALVTLRVRENKGKTLCIKEYGGESGVPCRFAMERRSFVNYLLGTSLGATALSILYPILEFLIPPAISEAQQNNVVAAIARELKPNTARIFKFGTRPGIVIRTAEGELRAFSAVCTHLNCTVQYRDDLRRMWCACHGGQFDLNGINVAGPPPRPLEQYAVNISGDDIVVSKH